MADAWTELTKKLRVVHEVEEDAPRMLVTFAVDNATQDDVRVELRRKPGSGGFSGTGAVEVEAGRTVNLTVTSGSGVSYSARIKTRPDSGKVSLSCLSVVPLA